MKSSQNETMASTVNSRPGRPAQQPQKSNGRHRKLITFLLSCCCFLAVFSACVLTALILIGKHNIHNNGTNLAEAKDPSKIPSKYKILRLSKEVVPIHYDVTLKTDLITGNYSGKVNITIDVKQHQTNILLHSKNLNVKRVNIRNAYSEKVISVVEVIEYKTDEIIKVMTERKVRSGKYFLAIDFSGNIRNRSVGYYASTYVDSKGQKRHMATSKFEPTYARQAYPCFDEPNMKANFTVHLQRPKGDGYIALSNMPEESTTEEGDNVMVHFQESVKMSTYLSCFIVSDFQSTADTISDGKDFRVYATPAQVEKTEYAKTLGKSVIEYYIDYFGIDFPLPKLDMAAIPDFVSGAMEHWGLVTFRETALLYSPETSSSANKQRVATVVAHELAHSWFGNLVTMNWWNDLWLNEGFATYIEYKGVHHAHEDWQMMDQFLIEQLHSVFVLDATLGSHPIVQTVITPDQITEIFDSISYNKGASVLRMLEDAVGDDVFKEGVKLYLTNHLYGNAVTQDLWDALQEVAGPDINITEFMNTWTMQMGYPVVDVATQGNSYVLTQKRYLTNPDVVDPTETPYNYKWTIPITYITNVNSTPQYVWLRHDMDEVTIDKPEATWIKFNYNQVGYYRVKYDDDHWKNLIENVNALSLADKAHLLEETFRLAESGDISYEIPLNLTMYLSEETEYIPWAITRIMLTQLELYLSNSPLFAQFKEYVIQLVTSAYESLSWTEDEDDSHLRRRARVEVLQIACSMGHEDALNEVSRLFRSWLQVNETLSQDLQSLIYQYGIAAGTTTDWNSMYDVFVRETDAAEKLRLMNGLASSRDTSLLIRLIEIAKVDGVVRSQDYFTLLQYISNNPIGTPIVWDYVRENWPQLVERFTLNDRYLGRLIPAITKRFTTGTKLDEMKGFFEKYQDAGAGAASRVQALETVENNIKWLEDYKSVVETWISIKIPSS